jgi:hypothetical protein
VCCSLNTCLVFWNFYFVQLVTSLSLERSLLSRASTCGCVVDRLLQGQWSPIRTCILL